MGKMYLQKNSSQTNRQAKSQATKTRLSEKPGHFREIPNRNPFGGLSASDHLTPAQILQLQRSYGNHFVSRLKQSKLTIARPHDQYEREADTLMHLPAPTTLKEGTDHTGVKIHKGSEPGNVNCNPDARGGGIQDPVASPLEGLAKFQDSERVYRAIVKKSTKKSLKFIQKVAAARIGITKVPGITTRPDKSIAPDFKFNTIGIQEPKTTNWVWYAQPSLTAKAYEGENASLYAGDGVHKTNYKESVGKNTVPVFWRVSKPIARVIYDGEMEHVNDHRQAYKISLKEAQAILDNHIIGKTFGPKKTEALARKEVLDTITAKLTHPKLGNDKTKWNSKYKKLSAKTAQRDTKGWHNVGLGNRKVSYKGPWYSRTAVKVTYTINKGTSKINKISSAKHIVY